MKKRIVKVLGFFALNILFFTILLGFVNQSDKTSGTSQAPIPAQKATTTENTASESFKNSNQKLIVSTVVAELAIN